jgi:hypothetical protein
MKRIYDFITRANQVLLLFALLGGIGGISYLVYSDAFGHQRPQSVPVVQASEEDQKAIVQDIRFLGETAGIYALGIVKREITARRGAGETSGILSKSFGYGDDDSGGEVVNVVFSDGSRKLRALLENDGLVLSHFMPRQFGKDFRSYIFICVTEDTDGNHILDKRDRTDLYVIAEGLKKPTMVVKGVLKYDIVEGGHIVAKCSSATAAHFIEIDTETSEQKGIEWK